MRALKPIHLPSGEVFRMSELLSRRLFLLGVASLPVLSLREGVAAVLSGPAMQSADVTIENFSANGKSAGMERVPKILKSEAEWKAQLSPSAFNVTRHEGTEIAGTGEYAESHGDGVYRCICCDTALYDSRTKFESGTGWPSFYKPISAANIVKSADNTLGMERDAISCRRCDAHLGHVFDDGPRPTGLRYCMNSVALHFVQRA
jgi:peptide-methionine (R)-S-oxide reductase